MRRAYGWVGLLVVLVGLLVGVGPLATPAAACSCVQPDATRSFQSADVVFVGTARTQPADAQQALPGVQEFELVRVTKGSPPREASGSVRVAGNVSCGPTLGQTGTQIVYAVATPYPAPRDPLDAELSVLACGASRALTAAELRSLVVAPPAVSTSPPTTRTPTPDDPAGVDGPLALLTLATVGGVVGFLLIARRHKRRVREARRRAARR